MITRKKHTGRQPGTRNKKNVQTRNDIWAYCEARGVDPFQTMVDLLEDDDKKIRLDAAKALGPYLLAPLQRQELVVTPSEAQQQIAALLGLDGASMN